MSHEIVPQRVFESSEFGAVTGKGQRYCMAVA